MPKTRRATPGYLKKTRPVPVGDFVRQIRVAHTQVHAEPGGPLGWLVRFAREDPAQWLPGEQEAHSYRLLACSMSAISDSEARRLALFTTKSTGVDFAKRLESADRISAVPGTMVPFLLAPADVLALHAELHAFFRACVTVPALREIEIPTAGLRMAIVRLQNPGLKPARMRRALGGTFRATLWHSIADWLVATDRLIACPTCGEPFLALRKKLFCSAPCLQKHHDQKKIEKRKQEKKGGPR